MSTPVPVSTPERRRAPRTTLARLAYIRIEPNNGGIVLNASADGLAFHSMAAVEPNGVFRFSLLDQNRRLDACGELTWTDEEQKIGGVRFTTLTEDARAQIQNWVGADDQFGGRPPSTLGSVILKAFPSFRFPRAAIRKEVGTSFPLAANLLIAKLRLRLTGFTGGLAAGLLVSTLCAAVFIAYGHRSDIGKTLIHWGERLAAQPSTNNQTAPPAIAANETLLTAGSAPAAARVPTYSPTPAKVSLPPAKTNNVQSTVAQPPVRVPLHSSRETSAILSSTANVMPPSTPASPAGINSPNVSLSSTVMPASLVPNNPAPLASLQGANTAPVRNFDEHAIAQMYFEVGKFKDEFLARNLSDRVSHLGYRASVTQKGHLWMNSYHVLVGPYGTEEEAATTQKSLVSNGYKPLPFERGSRGFIFGSSMSLTGAKLPIGDVNISWESYVSSANVKFAQGSYVLATATARWVKRPSRYQRNEYVYTRSGDGSRLLLEIHFSGLDRALVFRGS